MHVKTVQTVVKLSKSYYTRSAKIPLSGSQKKAKGLNKHMLCYCLQLSAKVCSRVPLASICEETAIQIFVFQCFVLSNACKVFWLFLAAVLSEDMEELLPRTGTRPTCMKTSGCRPRCNITLTIVKVMMNTWKTLFMYLNHLLPLYTPYLLWLLHGRFTPRFW